VTLAQFFRQKSFVITWCTRLLFLCGYGAQDFTKKRPKKKKKGLNFRSSIIIITTCRLAKGVCIILLGSLSIHRNIIHLVAALNVAFIIHHHDVWISEHGPKNLITRFRFRRSSSSSAAPGRRTQTAGPTSLPDSPPPPGRPSITYHPRRNIGSRGWGVTSGTRRMEGVSIVKELVGSRYRVECE
jgi:hypothetical protein